MKSILNLASAFSALQEVGLTIYHVNKEEGQGLGGEATRARG